MDYEKKYKEALEIAKAYKGHNVRLALEEILPELKESEDERIRKWLIYYFKEVCDDVSEKEKKGVIAWLEKQGEQKPTDKVEPKFKVGDTIKHLNGNVFHIARIDGTLYISDEGATISFGRENDWELIEQKPAWSEEDESMLYGVMETEQYMLDVVNGIKKFDVGNASIKEDCTRELNWLKSLKDRYTWKPSEEQMEVLLSEVTGWTKGCPKQIVLESLYQDLKKLKG